MFMSKFYVKFLSFAYNSAATDQKLFIFGMGDLGVGIMHQINFSSMCRSVTCILLPSKFASCLEDFLLEESCTWDDRSVSLRD